MDTSSNTTLLTEKPIKKISIPKLGLPSSPEPFKEQKEGRVRYFHNQYNFVKICLSHAMHAPFKEGISDFGIVWSSFIRKSEGFNRNGQIVCPLEIDSLPVQPI